MRSESKYKGCFRAVKIVASVIAIVLFAVGALGLSYYPSCCGGKTELCDISIMYEEFKSSRKIKIHNFIRAKEAEKDARKKCKILLREAAILELESELIKQELKISLLYASVSSSMWRNVGSWFGMKNTFEYNQPIFRKIDAEQSKYLSLKKRFDVLLCDFE